MKAQRCLALSKRKDDRALKKIFITGASSGIGLAIVKLLVAQGHEVRVHRVPRSMTRRSFAIGVPGFSTRGKNQPYTVEKNASVLAQIPPGRIHLPVPALTVYALTRPPAALDSSTRATALSKP